MPHIWRQQAQHILLRRILGNYCGAPIPELLNADSGKVYKVIDLCTGVGHWYVIHLSRYPMLTGSLPHGDTSGYWIWHKSFPL